MRRGLLDHSDWEKISQKIPDLEKLRGMALHFAPDFLSMNFKPESTVPEASVCLNDALRTLEQAVYALSEVFAHQVWYLEKKDPPSKMAAAFFGRFYADDVALRLYSAGEQYLVDAIKKMLEISEKQLAPYKMERKKKYKREEINPRKITRLEIVGDFLSAQETVYPFTEAIASLADLKEWKTTVDYRNRWVHEQPPTVKGLGIVYKRGRRWKPLLTGKGYTLGIGGGDKPEYSVDKLVKFIQPAMFKFTDTLTSVVKFYTELLKDAGKLTVQPLDKGEQ